jgi:hypothetical protein
MKKLITLFAIAGMVLALAPAAQAADIPLGNPLVPTGLGVGDTFQLVFVSSTTRDATSNLVADYDTHVQNAANAATIDLSGYTWKAITSTDSPLVHVQNHVSVTEAVYLVDGTKVASAGAFWSQNHDAAINIDENGDGLVTNVWTGSNWEGYRINGGLGSDGGINDPKESIFGLSNVTVSTWGGEAGLLDQTTSLPFYAVSEVLTVIVPEPATMSLLALGGLALLRRRRA